MKAVCIHCGKPKSGAWTICNACGRQPEESADVAQSVLLSDHNLLTEDLGALAGRVASGEGVQFRARDVERIAADIERTRKGLNVTPQRLVAFVGILFLIAAVMAVVIRATQR